MDRFNVRRELNRLPGSTDSFFNIWETYPIKTKEIRKFLRKEGNQLVISTTIIRQEQTIEYKNIFIDTLHSEVYLLNKAIPVSIEHADQVYIASNYDLELYGYGDTEDEAIDDLRKSIIECYEDLKQEKELGPIPSKMFAYYKSIIQEK
jgi:hypothetical protein